MPTPVSALFQNPGNDQSAITLALIADMSPFGRMMAALADKAAAKVLLEIVAADITNGGAFGRSILLAANQAAAKALLAYGTAADFNVGTNVNDIVQVITGGKLPALDGSNLTNIGTAIAAGSISDAQLANMPAGVKGATSTGPPSNMSFASLTALLSVATTGAQGMMSAADKTKLNAYPVNERFKGSYVNLGALVTAYPTGAAGDWAILTAGSGVDASIAAWDSDNTVPAWINTGASISLIDNSVTNAILANMAANTVKMSLAGGDPLDGTASQLMQMLATVADADANLLALNLKMNANIKVQTVTGVSGNASFNGATADIFDYTLNGATTLNAISGMAANKPFFIRLRQDATGGRAISINATVFKVGQIIPSFSVAASAIDVIACMCRDGTTVEIIAINKGVQ